MPPGPEKDYTACSFNNVVVFFLCNRSLFTLYGVGVIKVDGALFALLYFFSDTHPLTVISVLQIVPR